MAAIDRILCIRMVKRPPEVVRLNIPFDITICITDDVGELMQYSDLPLRLSCLNAQTLTEKCANLVVVQTESCNSSLLVSMNRGLYHTVKVVVRPTGGSAITDFALCVSVDGYRMEQQALSPSSADFVAFIGETTVVFDALSSEQRLYTRTCAGPLQIVEFGKAETTVRIDSTLVNLYPAYSDELRDSLDGLIRLQEEPNMRLIGDHVWHSSMVMAFWLMRSLASCTDVASLTIELGAGLGIVSLALALTLRDLSGSSRPRIVATDLPEVAQTTLKRNVQRHSHLAKTIQVTDFTWGDSLTNLMTSAVESANELTVLASDVLYNRESHPLFLDALTRLRKASSGNISVYIAYKHRIAGDGDFFSGAILEHFIVHKIYTVAGIEIYRLDSRR